MPRHSVTLAALFVASFLGFIGYSYWKRPESAAEVNIPAESKPAQSIIERTEQPVTTKHNDEVSAAQAITSDMVDRWIAEATGDDAKSRAAAIAALAGAPRAQALPVLRRVLNVGEPTVDRPLALRSLRTLALQQGDADGAIRNVLREAIYHGDDVDVTRDAQAMLADVENGMDQNAPNTHP